MYKRLSLVLVSAICFLAQSKAQIRPLQMDSITWDSLYREIPEVPNARDSVFFYEKLINDKIGFAINRIRLKSDTSVNKEIKNQILISLSKLQKTYKDFINNEKKLLFLSYGSFYGGHERGKLSGYFQVYLLKQQYFYISAIVENALTNFLQY